MTRNEFEMAALQAISAVNGNNKQDKSWKMAALADQRINRCDVYWGGHCCNLEPGHYQREPGQHLCKCGQVPYEHSVMWGIDLSWEERVEMPQRQEMLKVVESGYWDTRGGREARTRQLDKLRSLFATDGSLRI